MNQIELVANAAKTVVPSTLEIAAPHTPVSCWADAGWAAFVAAKAAFAATKEADYAIVGRINRGGHGHVKAAVPSLAGFASAELSSDALIAACAAL